MTLSGNIESFPLSEVMRLAARSKQSGLLRLESGGMHGRIYFQDGFLTYATTRDHDDLGGDLGQLGLIDPHLWYPVERGEEPITSALVEGKTEDDLREFFTERVADVLVRLLRSRHGRFDFAEHSDPQYVTGQRFEIEDVLRGVESRVEQWAEIEAVIPVDDATVHLVPDLGDREEVAIAGDTWRIIAVLGAASTVEEVADQTGLSDFVVARTMAEMVDQGLLEVLVASGEQRLGPSLVPSDPITVSAAATPSGLESGLANDEMPSRSAEQGPAVELVRRPDDRSGTGGR